jgi:dynein heavy chain 1, cytosolic
MFLVRQMMEHYSHSFLSYRLRQYASYEFVRKLLQGYAKVNGLVVQLKSDALKERHWKTLCRQLRVNWVLSDLNLGQVWDVDLQKNEPVIRDVISVAQGEMALEEFLKQVGLNGRSQISLLLRKLHLLNAK